jgi:hypothetical protein
MTIQSDFIVVTQEEGQIPQQRGEDTVTRVVDVARRQTEFVSPRTHHHLYNTTSVSYCNCIASANNNTNNQQSK